MSEAQRPLCLDQFLKLAGIAASGGQAKVLIQGRKIKLNGVVETRRRRKLVRGDQIGAGGKIYSPDEYL